MLLFSKSRSDCLTGANSPALLKTNFFQGSVVPETWYTFSENNKMMAEQAMAESQRLREAIFHSIEQTSNDLRVQQDATNFDFRKRHYEMKRAKEEAEYQMRSVRNFFAQGPENFLPAARYEHAGQWVRNFLMTILK